MLLSGVQGITDLITTPGLINLDFADVKSVMSGAGSALMGIGSSRGDDRAVAAAEMAISSPLLEASIDGAHGVLLSIQGGSDLGLFEINEAAQLVANSAAVDANIIFGAVIDDALGDEVRVTVIAAGFDEQQPNRAASAPLTLNRSAGQRARAARPAQRPGQQLVRRRHARRLEPPRGPSSRRPRRTRPPAAARRRPRRRPRPARPRPPGAARRTSSARPRRPRPPAAAHPTRRAPTPAAVHELARRRLADPVAGVPAQTGGDGASAGYVPSPVSFVSPDGDDDDYDAKPAAATAAGPATTATATPTPRRPGPPAGRTPARAGKQDTVFDVSAGRRRPVVFEEDDDLDVPDFLK